MACWDSTPLPSISRPIHCCNIDAYTCPGTVILLRHVSPNSSVAAHRCAAAFDHRAVVNFLDAYLHTDDPEIVLGLDANHVAANAMKR